MSIVNEIISNIENDKINIKWENAITERPLYTNCVLAKVGEDEYIRILYYSWNDECWKSESGDSIVEGYVKYWAEIPKVGKEERDRKNRIKYINNLSEDENKLFKIYINLCKGVRKAFNSDEEFTDENKFKYICDFVCIKYQNHKHWKMWIRMIREDPYEPRVLLGLKNMIPYFDK